MVKHSNERRNLIVGLMNDMPGFKCTIPKEAFYVFPSFEQKISDRDLAEKIIKSDVLVVPESAFGSNGWIT